MNAWRAVSAVLLGLVGVTAGCKLVGPIAYYLQPPQIQKPEYEFPTGTRVTLVIEARDSQHENPVFSEALYERVVTMLRQVTDDSVFFCGGGAQNKGVCEALRARLGREVYVPAEPQYVVARGAALLAGDTR